MEALPAPLLTDSSPDLDLRRVWATVARSAWLILGCVLLSLGATVVSSRLVPAAGGSVSVRALSNRPLRSVRGSALIVLPGITFRLRDSLLTSGPALVRVTSLEDASNLVRSRVTVAQPNQNANILTVRYEGNDPVLVRDVSNALAARYVRNRRDAEKAVARNRLAFLTPPLHTLPRHIRLPPHPLTAFLQANNII